jgi:flagella basal body P-ring formation protein FlgA
VISRNTTTRLVLLVCGAGCLLSAASIESGASASRSSCLPISSDWIYGRDLARALPQFASLPPDLVLSFAPVPGLERVFRPAELRRLADAHQLDGSGISSAVCFAWPLAVVSRDAIRAAIESTLTVRNPLAKVEVIEIDNQSLAAAPAGPVYFPLSGLSAFSDKPVIWKGYVSYTGSRRFNLWASVRIVVRESHLVSRLALQPGDPALVSQPVEESYRGPLTRERALESFDQLTRLTARRNLPAGTTLLESMFEITPEVQRGDLVRVQVEAGAARIETQAIAEQAGRHGQIISVKNPKTKQPYRVRVEEKGFVTLVPGGGTGLVVGEERKS